MNSYELTLVLAGSMPESRQKAVLEKVKKTVGDSEGSVANTSEWGKKHLAYKIKHETEAFYFLLDLTLPADRVSGFSRMIDNDEQVMRHLLVVKRNTPLREPEATITKKKKNEEPKEPVKGEKVVDKTQKKTETISKKSTKGTKKAK